nr:MAG TPA: hypothetical protein [Caudoviricetes sp.]
MKKNSPILAQCWYRAVFMKKYSIRYAENG